MNEASCCKRTWSSSYFSTNLPVDGGDYNTEACGWDGGDCCDYTDPSNPDCGEGSRELCSSFCRQVFSPLYRGRCCTQGGVDELGEETHIEGTIRKTRGKRRSRRTYIYAPRPIPLRVFALPRYLYVFVTKKAVVSAACLKPYLDGHLSAACTQCPSSCFFSPPLYVEITELLYPHFMF